MTAVTVLVNPGASPPVGAAVTSGAADPSAVVVDGVRSPSVGLPVVDPGAVEVAPGAEDDDDGRVVGAIVVARPAAGVVDDAVGVESEQAPASTETRANSAHHRPGA